MVKQESVDAELCAARGKAKFDAGNFQGAIDELTKAIKLNPDLADAYHWRGEAKWNLKNYQAAVTDYNKALKLKPDYTLTFYNNGKALIAVKEYAGAVVHLTKAVYLSPSDADPYLARGNAKTCLKDYQGAIADYNKVVDLRPDDAEAYISRANVRTVLKNYKGAIVDYKKAIDLKPDYADAYRCIDRARKLLEDNAVIAAQRLPAGDADTRLFKQTSEKAAGILILSITPPDARVVINGDDHSYKALIELPANKYVIDVQKEGYYGQTGMFDIFHAGVVALQFSLFPKAGTLRFSVQPPDARVELLRDGAAAYAWEGSNLGKEVLEGSYELVCRAEGHLPVRKQIAITERATLDESVVLQKDPSSVHSTTIDVVFVEGGTFRMGGDGQFDEKPIHKVRVSAFEIGKYAVTQRQWKEVMGNNPSNFRGDNLPVDQVSWHDVQEFIQKLNRKGGTDVYRLPTEAEWEFAARGGMLSCSSPYSGGSAHAEVAWSSENSGKTTHAVGTKLPNELGIYDMSGNVWEWCQDWYDKEYYVNAPTANPARPSSGSYRVLRGGSWLDSPSYCGVSVRSLNNPGIRNSGNGFRLVRFRPLQ